LQIRVFSNFVRGAIGVGKWLGKYGEKGFLKHLEKSSLVESHHLLLISKQRRFKYQLLYHLQIKERNKTH